MTATTTTTVSLNVKAEAARLRASGMSYAAIGRQLGASRATVIYWLDPEYRQRQLDYKRDRWCEGRAAREAAKAAAKPPEPLAEVVELPKPREAMTPQDITRGYRDQLAAGFDPLEAMDACRECAACGRLKAPISRAYGPPCDCPRVVRAEKEAA